MWLACFSALTRLAAALIKMSEIVKTCSRCGESKPVCDFSKASKTVRNGIIVSGGGLHGVRSQCKKCMNEKNKTWRLKNVESERIRRSKWSAANRDKIAVYRKNYDKAKIIAKNKRRMAAQIQRTPAWAYKDAIDFAYHAANTIFEVYGGTKPHVDHIIPLRGRFVSGLHVENNLQLLSAKQNSKKGNKHRA